MGGIFCATARDDVVPSVMRGLRSLERKGSDSVGLGMLVERQIQRRRATGSLDALEALLVDAPVLATTVIGQTCWDTQGERCRRNAHPHASARVAIVHTGIVENHAELRCELEREGVQFRSETDSEVIVWLLNRELADGAQPIVAMRRVLPRLQGSYALALICAQRGDRVYAARRGIALTAARSVDTSWLSTDAGVLFDFADEMVPLQDGQIAELTPGRVRIVDPQLAQRPPRWHRSESLAARRRSEQRMSGAHYAEILEQPATIERILLEFQRDIRAGESERWCGPLWRAKRLLAVGSGMSHHAAHVGRAWLERIAGIPVELELSSELEARKPILEDGTMALLLSQTGEEEDALCALRHLKTRNVPTVALTHAVAGRVARDADALLDCRVGPEIGTSRTHGFVAQLGTLAAASLAIRRLRDGRGSSHELPSSLLSVPEAMRAALELEDEYASIGRSLAFAGRGIYVGRGTNHPLALVGALQLESLSELSAEGLAGGELEHSTIADGVSGVPVVLVAPGDDTLDWTLSDARAASARGAKPMLLGDARSARLAMEHEISSLSLGALAPPWAPIVLSSALHMLAYHAGVACARRFERSVGDSLMTATHR